MLHNAGETPSLCQIPTWSHDDMAGPHEEGRYQYFYVWTFYVLERVESCYTKKLRNDPTCQIDWYTLEVASSRARRLQRHWKYGTTHNHFQSYANASPWPIR